MSKRSCPSGADCIGRFGCRWVPCRRTRIALRDRDGPGESGAYAVSAALCGIALACLVAWALMGFPGLK